MGVNLSAACMFGYSKLEIQGHNVSMLQPSIFASNHDDILRHYLDGSERGG